LVGRRRTARPASWGTQFASSPLFDIGNMLRFGDEVPPTFAACQDEVRP
jgi:hypothetical protein